MNMSFTIFNNPEVVAKGWYIVCASRDLPVKRIQSFDLCGQRIAVFRGVDGGVRSLDAYCPHMGTDLGIGDVVGNQARCFFHHWAFDGAGECQQIPCQSHIPTGARLQSYATAEKYGFVWVYPEAIAPFGIPEFDELQGHEVIAWADKPLQRQCHHHICMMNGIDVQHLQTVHNLPVDMELSLEQDKEKGLIDFTLTGDLPNGIGQRLLGKTYTYAMRYSHGCIGLLTMMKNVRFLPPLHLVYAYVPLATGKTRIQPIYVTRKRKGPIGWLVSMLLLLVTRLCYYALRGEDGKIYDNIQFNPQNLLEIDRPLVKYIQYVNNLVPSRWSNIMKKGHDIGNAVVSTVFEPSPQPSPEERGRKSPAPFSPREKDWG